MVFIDTQSNNMTPPVSLSLSLSYFWNSTFTWCVFDQFHVFTHYSHLVSKSNQNFPNSWCIQLSNPSTSRIGYGFKKSILNFFRSRRSRSQSGSPPYGRLPVSLPPIERPKTMGSQVSARSGGSRTRETNNKPRSGKNEVQDYLVYKRTCIPKFTFSH